MGMDKLQTNQMQQKQMEESQHANKAAFERELEQINKSAKLHQTMMQRVEANKEARDPQPTNLLDTPADKVNVALLAKLTASIAASNINLSSQNMAAKVASEMGAELNLLLQTQPNLGDIAVMSKPVTQTEKDEAKNTNVTKDQPKKGAEKEGKDLSTSRETVSTVKEYTASYASVLINAGGEIKRKMERLEEELREKGMGEKDIKALKGKVKKSVSADLAKVIKESYLRSMLAKGRSIERVMASKNLNDALNIAEQSEGVTSSYEEGSKGLAKELAKQAKAEAKDFILEEIEVKLMEKILSGQTKELESELKHLVGLAFKLGVNMGQFMTRWKEKKVNLGLFYLDPKLAAQLGMGGESEEERESSYDMEKDEEKEILMNRMRALYMRRAIKGDFFTRLDTAFKMRKLKNGLIKLGLKIDDFERIEKEGVAVAKVKLIDMLKEALSERATLYDLAGPAFKLIEKRIKGIMSNLDRIGEALSVGAFENLRDTINRKMYDMAIEELHAVDGMLNKRSNPGLEKKRGKLIKLITRIKEESGIEGSEISPRNAELLRHGIEGLKVIQESA